MDDNLYTLIRKKGTKYHSKPSVYGMIKDGKYYVCTDKGKKAKELSFDYVAYKAKALSEWSHKENVDAYIWLDPMYGTIKGLSVLYRLIDAIEFYCKVTGKECEAMLCPALVDYEGFKVRAMIKDKAYEGTVERKGLIALHFIRKDGAQWARYIKPYELVSVELL